MSCHLWSQIASNKLPPAGFNRYKSPQLTSRSAFLGIAYRVVVVGGSGVSSLGCALVAVKACLLVLLCCVHVTKFLTRHLPCPVDLLKSTVVPSVRYTREIEKLIFEKSSFFFFEGLIFYLLIFSRVPAFLVYRSSN
jgi:hypothetical protein